MNKKSYADFGLNEKLNLVLAEIKDAKVTIKKLAAVSEQLKVEIEASKTKSKKPRDTAMLYKRRGKYMTQLSDAEYDITERMLEKIIPILADAIREVENIRSVVNG